MKRKTPESEINSSSSNDVKSPKAQKKIELSKESAGLEEKCSRTLQISIKDLTTLVMTMAQLPGDSLKLLDNYDQIIKAVDWNQKNAQGKTLVFIAMRNGLKGNTNLLDVLTKLPGDILETIDWNYRFLIGGETTLFCVAIKLAQVKRYELLNKLLTLPINFLKGIQWGSSTSYKLSPTFLILSLYSIPQFPRPHLKNLLHKELLLCLDWRDEVIIICQNLFDTCEMAEALSILPIATLQAFQNLPTITEYPKIKKLLVFLIELKAQQPLSPASIDFCQQSSLQASVAYYLIALQISEKYVEYLEKVIKTSVYYPRAQLRLAHLILPELKSTGSKTEYTFLKGLSAKKEQKQITSLNDENEDNISEHQTRRLNLDKAFGHACQWFYYNKSTSIDQKSLTLVKIVEKIFLMEEPQIIGLSSDWQAKLKQFIKELAMCGPIYLENNIEFFLEEIKEYHLKKQLNNLKDSLETPLSFQNNF